MTLAELKTAVRAQFDNGNHETANQWVTENFGDLRKRETWQAAYDRCAEFIAAARDVIESEQGQAVITAAKATIAKAALLTMDAAIWVIKAAVIATLVILELCQEGSIDRLTGRAQTTAEKVQKFSVDYLTKLNKLQLVQLAQAEGLVVDSRIKAADIRAKLLEVP
jgi:rhamnose utilization protein RhaD (predicted bifunctional aldolase and dehydrogenase)